jgi:hypothetical protein
MHIAVAPRVHPASKATVQATQNSAVCMTLSNQSTMVIEEKACWQSKHPGSRAVPLSEVNHNGSLCRADPYCGMCCHTLCSFFLKFSLHILLTSMCTFSKAHLPCCHTHVSAWFWFREICKLHRAALVCHEADHCLHQMLTSVTVTISQSDCGIAMHIST